MIQKKYDCKIIMVAKGKKVNSVYHLDSCFVRTQLNSIKPYIESVIPFAIENTVSPISILKSVLSLRKEIDKIQPDIVHAQYGSTTALVGLLATYRKKIPLVISFCGSDLIKVSQRCIMKRFRHKLAVIISKFCAWYAETIIVKSINLYNALPEIVKKKTWVLPNGVDITRFRIISKKEARKLLLWSSESYVILFNKGWFNNVSVKDPELVEAVFSILKTRMNNVVLKKIGRVSYNKMPTYLSAANLLLVVSRSEGSPNIVKEAMACNLPVVTVRCGDVSERLKNVFPGEVVNSREPKAIANTILKVSKLGKKSNGRKEIKKQKLNITSISRSLIAIYKKTIDEFKSY